MDSTYDYSIATKMIEDDYARRNPNAVSGPRKFIRTTSKYTVNPPRWDKYGFTVHMCDSKKSMSLDEIHAAHVSYAKDFNETCETLGDIAIELIMAIEDGVITVVNGEI